MNLLKDVCRTFCDGLAIREIPIGYAIRTPFKSPDGDAVGIYIRRHLHVQGQVRLEDDGSTLATLQDEGFSIESEPRFRELSGLLAEHGCMLDEVDYLIHTDYIDEDQAANHFLRFMALMLRVSDMRMLSRDKVRDTFKADLQEFIEEIFSGTARVERDAAPGDLSDYVADVLVVAPDKTLAIYAGTSEVKALEAFVLWQEVLRQNLKNVIPIIVFERAKPQQIKARTMSRVMNSGVVLASMDGGKWDVTQKLRAQAGIQATLQ